MAGRGQQTSEVTDVPDVAGMRIAELVATLSVTPLIWGSASRWNIAF
jgi:hypothetical protein